jgi:tripartite motif-containing protein 71
MSRYFCVMVRLCADALWFAAAAAMVFFLAGQTVLADYAIVKTIGSLGSGDGQFEEPGGIAVDSSDNVFVSDTLNNRIQEFDSSGALVRIIGTSGTGNGQLKFPRGLAIDAAGNLWVADAGNQRIQEFTTTGNFVQQFGGTPQMQSPIDLDFDSSGNVWVADQNNGALEYTSSGTFVKQIASSRNFPPPSSIAIDSSDNIWATNLSTSSMGKFDNNGTLLIKPNLVLLSPHAVAIDFNGNIWEGDSSGRLVELDANGSPRQLVRADQQLLAPGGIDFDSHGDIWVTDYLYNHVFEFAPVPEPGSFVLAGIGGLLLVGISRSSQRRKM